MATKVTVYAENQTRVSVNTNKQETVRTIAIGNRGGASALSDLTDVDTSGASNNEVLVYDANTQKYVVKEVEIININGGTF